MRVKIHQKEASRLGLDWDHVLSELNKSPLVMNMIDKSLYFYFRIDIIEINEHDFPGSDPSTHGFWMTEEYPYCLQGGPMEHVFMIHRAEKKPFNGKDYDLWRTIK